MNIIGLRIEKYIGKSVSGDNCDFKYEDAEFDRHVICGVLSDNRKVEITLSASEGECYSGWTTASFGAIEVKEIPKFGGYTFVPIIPIVLDDIIPDTNNDISNYVFSVSWDGGDEYYPSGNYSVNMELFKPTARGKNKRPVWIFKGKSDSGKSFLSSRLSELEVYETDINSTLPEKISASVVVLGNKYQFSINEIETKLIGNPEIQIVNFE